jgi:hypothetical protein
MQCLWASMTGKECLEYAPLRNALTRRSKISATAVAALFVSLLASLYIIVHNFVLVLGCYFIIRKGDYVMASKISISRY